jgi:predicted nucleic acid-binding protein
VTIQLDPPFVFDTCFLSNAIHPKAPARWPHVLTRYCELVRGQGLILASASLFELRRGMQVSGPSGPYGPRRRAELERVLSTAEIIGIEGTYGATAGWEAASLLWADAFRADCKFRDTEDLLIAATAEAAGFRVITTDADFAKTLRAINRASLVELVAI